MDEAKKLSGIFDRLEQYTSTHLPWSLNSLEEFIISFERNSQAANEENARYYGNIVKDLVQQIQLRDSILLNEDDRENIVLKRIIENNTLKEMFSKLYVYVHKNYEKAERKRKNAAKKRELQEEQNGNEL